MKNSSHSRLKKILTTAFNVRKWSDFDRMKEFTLYLENGVRNLFIPRRQTAEQTFEEALRQYQVDDES